MSTKSHPKMSTKCHPKRGHLVDKSVHEKSPKSVHEKSPFDNVHEKSLILKKSVHEMSPSLHIRHVNCHVHCTHKCCLTWKSFEHNYVGNINLLNIFQIQKCKVEVFTCDFTVSTYVVVMARSSGILKAKQKLGVTFNSDNLGGIDFTKFSKLSMCSAGAGRCWLV